MVFAVNYMNPIYLFLRVNCIDLCLLQMLMIIKHAILSTDLSRLEDSKKNIDALLGKPHGLDWNLTEDRLVPLGES